METKKKIIKQNMLVKGESSLEIAEKYYAILSAVNDLKLAKREIQLVAFTAIRGNISLANVRQEFCTKYKSTGATINNIVSKLKKRKIFMKKGNTVFVNPVIVLDFDKEIALVIQLNNEA